MIRGQTNLPLRRAAAYARVSADNQQPVASEQMDVIREFAKRHGMQIVKEYSDERVKTRGRECRASAFAARGNELYFP